jgi:serine/threonine protein kinase
MVKYMCIVSLAALTFEVLLVSVFGKASNSTTSDNCTDFHCGAFEVFQKLFPISVRRDGCTEGPESPEDLSLFCSSQKLFLEVNTQFLKANYTVRNINFTAGTMMIDTGDTFDQCTTPLDWIEVFQPYFFPINTVVLHCNSSLSGSDHCSPANEANQYCGGNASCAAEQFGENEGFCCYLQSPKTFEPIDNNTSAYNSCILYGSQGSLSNSSNTEGDIDLHTFPLKWQPGPPGQILPPVPSPHGSNSTQRTLDITGGVLGGLLGVVLVISLFYCFCRRSGRMKISKSNSAQMPLARGYSRNLSSEGAGMTHLFSYKELEDATQGFSAAVELGGGGFGTVYKGKLADGRVIAVKKLNQEGRQGLQQFHNEVTVLSHVHHPHLVHLLGCCVEVKRHALLVYEFVSNGSLAQHLHGQDSCLPWETRLNVAIQTADALMYLHCLVNPPIFHRDVKTTNILLDAQFRAKVADFGLSRLVPTSTFEMTHISTAPQGTPGYLDPDYHHSYQLSDKSDVYSFGVVLMELITAKKAVDMTRERKEINLASLAVAKIQAGTLDEIIDPYLKMRFNEGSRTNIVHTPDADKLRDMVNRVAELAFRCLATEKDDRPNMKEVLEELRSIRVYGYSTDPANLAAHDASSDTRIHGSLKEGEYIELDLSSYSANSLYKDTKPLIKSEDQHNLSWPHSPASAEEETAAWVNGSSSEHSLRQMWHEINLKNPQAR